MLRNKELLSVVVDLLIKCDTLSSSWYDEWKIAGSEGGNVHYSPHRHIGSI